MLVELHILQNFAPSNLNRDDTGAAKDCEFGGYRRARISSQCLKRAVRECFRDQSLIPKDHLARRTKRIVDEVANRLGEHGRERAKAVAVAENALKAVELKIDDDRKTQYLLYVGEAEIAALANVCQEHWDKLVDLSNAGTETQSAKKMKKTAKDTIPDAVRKAVAALLDGGKAADLALFGRMLADMPEKNIDAAAQVAHALSTNRVSVEFDYYTAVDDLKPEDTAGADMIGTIEFNSACFYRYANLDLAQLFDNLKDEELARTTVAAFVRASVIAIPIGKQNSMAAQNPPSFVMAVVRRSGPWSLANAFLQPARPDATGDLIRKSLDQLDDYWGRLIRMYGNKDIVGTWYVALDGDGTKYLGNACENFDSLVENVMSKVVFETVNAAL
jgi:CRISPR system Cascade subunit CasC